MHHRAFMSHALKFGLVMSFYF